MRAGQKTISASHPSLALVDDHQMIGLNIVLIHVHTEGELSLQNLLVKDLVPQFENLFQFFPARYRSDRERAFWNREIDF